MASFTITEIITRLSVAIAIGAIIGAEREYRSKSAGLRTMILICLGSTVFTMLSQLMSLSSPERIASNIVTGIGFIGAGVIFRMESNVSGITTAASIWVTASLGIAVGSGHPWIASLTMVCVILVLYTSKYFEDMISNRNIIRDYKIVYTHDVASIQKFDNAFAEYKLSSNNRKQIKKGNLITGYWTAQGSKKNHAAFAEDILNDDSVIEFEY